MPAAWTAKQERQYVAIKKSCYKRRRCRSAAKSGKKACVSACFGLSKGSRRNKCIVSCKTTASCKKDCNSMAAATVNKARGRASKRRR